jgi:outer membrane protein assembly factor BamB
MNHAASSTVRKPIRLWPGVVAAVLLALIKFVLPAVAPEFLGLDTTVLGVLGGLVVALVIVIWWVFFSRAPWLERLGAIVVMVVAVVATRPLMHMSIQNGMMGMMFFIYAVPTTLSLAFVAWAVATRGMSNGPRRAALVVAILIGCGVWGLARTNGILGGVADLEWRWTPTAEERLLAQAAAEPAVPHVVAPVPSERGARVEGPKVEPAAPVAPLTPPAVAKTEPVVPMNVEWSGFRGPNRDDVVHGAAINTDWTAAPPVELWRRPIGPGWSSFAVADLRLYTQEQRGDEEIVACYDATTGKPVWMHRDNVRFWESNGGAGPRATPTLSQGRVFTLGATGILNALDARTGAVAWTRNVSTDSGVKVPEWGFAASPLVIDDVVVIAASGALAAYDVASGKPRWSRKSGGGSYSSPHLATIDGVRQILLLTGAGVSSVALSDGTLLWENAWAGVPIVQPAQIAGGDLLITTADAMGALGIRRIAVAHGAPTGGWRVEERWTSRGLKPYFNDYVVHEGHAYGFDGSILSCIDLADGARKWKGGRYGNGQLILLADQDVMLVLSEEGELALVRAAPDQFTELARFKVLDAKTWNHPVLVGDMLFVRNGEEMAAFRLSLGNR